MKSLFSIDYAEDIHHCQSEKWIFDLGRKDPFNFILPSAFIVPFGAAAPNELMKKPPQELSPSLANY